MWLKSYFYALQHIIFAVLTTVMSVLFILIIVSILVAASFLGAFLWSVKNGQYEDGYTPSVRMLFDDELTVKKNKEENKPTK